MRVYDFGNFGGFGYEFDWCLMILEKIFGKCFFFKLNFNMILVLSCFEF